MEKINLDGIEIMEITLKIQKILERVEPMQAIEILAICEQALFVKEDQTTGFR